MPPLTAPPSPRVARRPAKRTLPRWMKRGLKIMLVLTVCGLAAAGWRTGRLASLAQRAGDDGIGISAALGFRVEDVEVTGRIHTDPHALLAAAGLGRGDPILAFDPEDARQRIESLPWVASAAVERRLPGMIAITIVERTPIALWQHNEKITLIDADGANLGPVAIESAPPELPLVVGGDAAEHARDLLAMLNDHPEIARRVQASSWIGSRRWDLKLDNGVEIRLPEDGAGEALNELAEAEASTRLLERDIAAVDLRVAGKMVVRLTHEPPAAAPAKPKPQQGI